jgi:hypothetical protein
MFALPAVRSDKNNSHLGAEGKIKVHERGVRAPQAGAAARPERSDYNGTHGLNPAIIAGLTRLDSPRIPNVPGPALHSEQIDYSPTTLRLLTAARSRA